MIENSLITNPGFGVRGSGLGKLSHRSSVLSAVLALVLLFLTLLSSWVLVTGKWRLFGAEDRALVDSAKERFAEQLRPALIRMVQDLGAAKSRGISHKTLENGNRWEFPFPEGRAVYVVAPTGLCRLTDKGTETLLPSVHSIYVKALPDGMTWQIAVTGKVKIAPGRIELIVYNYTFAPSRPL